MNIGLIRRALHQEVQAAWFADSYAVLAAVEIIKRKDQYHRIEKNAIEVHFDI